MVENNQVAHKAVEMGARGNSGASSETMVAIKGLAENAVVIAGAVGALREGTTVKFTQGAVAAAQAASAPTTKSAP